MIDHRQAARAERGLGVLRLTLALLLLIHGIVRVYNNGIFPFGEWLQLQGVPLGLAVAMLVTAWELSATWLLAFGPKRWLPLICLVFAGIYACGIWLLHAAEGWFVVGAGRNGSEYSVLLIVTLLMLAWIYWPAMRSRR